MGILESLSSVWFDWSYKKAAMQVTDTAAAAAAGGNAHWSVVWNNPYYWTSYILIEKGNP